MFESHKEEPLLCWLHFMDSHRPWDAGGATYLSNTKLPSNRWADNFQWSRATELTDSSGKRFLGLVSEAFDNKLAILDFQLGRLFSYLESSTHSNDTTVILMSDHGKDWQSGINRPHGYVPMSDQFLRIPLLIKNSNMRSTNVNGFVQVGIDFFPTLASLAQQPIPDGLLGRDLLSKNHSLSRCTLESTSCL